MTENWKDEELLEVLRDALRWQDEGDEGDFGIREVAVSYIARYLVAHGVARPRVEAALLAPYIAAGTFPASVGVAAVAKSFEPNEYEADAAEDAAGFIENIDNILNAPDGDEPLAAPPVLSCGVCTSEDLVYLGALGKRQHYRCRACGIDSSTVPE